MRVRYTSSSPEMHAHIKFGISSSNNIRDMLRTRIFLKLVSVQGQGDLKIVCNIPPFQDASINLIWDSYLKKYKRYAQDTIILKTRSAVKVTVTRKWYVTLHHPKMHAHTPNLGFLPQIIREICSRHDYSKIYVRGQGQCHSDPKMKRETLPSQYASTH